MIALHLNASNSRNGNPQRLLLVLDGDTGVPVACVDEDYDGPTGALERAGFGDVAYDRWSGTLAITPGEYRRLLRDLPNTREALDNQRQEA